jgi:hypothetical protein
MNDFKFVSEKYSIHKTKNYRLSIQVNPDGLSLLVLDRDNKVLKIIHRFTRTIEGARKLFRSEEELIKLRELSFASCKILINSPTISLFPEQELTEVSEEGMMQIEFEKPEKPQFKTRKLADERISYSFYPEDLMGFHSDFRNNPGLYHVSGLFLDYVCEKAESNKDATFIYTSPGIIHIAYLSGKELKYFNVYRGKNDEELLYHLINTCHRLNIREESPVYYSGHIVKSDEKYTVMSRYFKNISFLPNEFDFELAGNINENYFSYLLRSIQ